MKTITRPSTSRARAAAGTHPKAPARGRRTPQAGAAPAAPAALAVPAGIREQAETTARLKAAATAQEQARMVVDSALTEALNYWAEDRLARLGIPMPDKG